VAWARAQQRVLIVAAALLLAFSLAAARRAARTPLAEPAVDDPRIDVRIDVNGSAAADLEALPGVGKVLAARIVAHRESHGLFRSLDDLGDVPGVGRKLAEELRPLVTLGGLPDQ
jgi:competence ComEA-like helix-hairpin-helix protein